MAVTAAEKARFKRRVHGSAEKRGARLPSRRAMKWASYSTSRRLTFDASVLDLREGLRDYVSAHEFLPFHALNHGRLWKSLMRAHLGEYEDLEGESRLEARKVAAVRRR